MLCFFPLKKLPIHSNPMWLQTLSAVHYHRLTTFHYFVIFSPPCHIKFSCMPRFYMQCIDFPANSHSLTALAWLKRICSSIIHPGRVLVYPRVQSMEGLKLKLDKSAQFNGLLASINCRSMWGRRAWVSGDRKKSTSNLTNRWAKTINLTSLFSSPSPLRVSVVCITIRRQFVTIQSAPVYDEESCGFFISFSRLAWCTNDTFIVCVRLISLLDVWIYEKWRRPRSTTCMQASSNENERAMEWMWRQWGRMTKGKNGKFFLLKLTRQSSENREKAHGKTYMAPPSAPHEHEAFMAI